MTIKPKIMRLRAIGILVLCYLLVVSAYGKKGDVPMVKVQPERLPDLNIPRFGHSVLSLNGELIVVGGHTKGFVPTATVEIYRDGKWHLQDMTYIHDAGMVLPLKSGNILIAGGFEKNLGIGQSYEVEMYHPQPSVFEGFGCLERKRASFSGMELDGGRVLITGNWYHNDGIEIFDGDDHFTFVKDVAQQRVNPYVFKIAPDDAIVLGGMDPWSHLHDSILIDRLKGESFTVPLFSEWKPQHVHVPYRSADSFIGDESKGIYAYLFPVVNAHGQVAIAKVEGTDFTLLPTVAPIPKEFKRQPIKYYSSVLVDQKAQRAYLLGCNDKGYEATSRHYILCVEYGKIASEGAAPLTLYYTDPMLEMASSVPVLNDEGDFLLVGGKPASGNPSDNFRPSASVLLFHFGTPDATVQVGSSLWLWLSLILLIAFLVVAFFVLWWRKRQETRIPAVEGIDMSPSNSDEELFQRVCQLMEKERLYQNNNLKVADVSGRLGVNSRYVSNCINELKGCSFTQFVNGYRVRYAQELLRENPDAKMTNVYVQAGFSNEVTFFRTFKMHVGMTPREWIEKID